MPSYVAWLDASTEAERRAREVLALFRQAQSRDELGLGQIRDAFSDAMFPGMSVIQTRARYFLLVPWLFRIGADQHKLEGRPLQTWVQQRERDHISWLIHHTSEAGVIGGDVGPGVKLLPSTIYWSGLIRYGILTRDIGADQLHRVPPMRRDEDAEPSTRPATTWVSTLPEPPPGFAVTGPESLALQREEAQWLRERIIDAVPGSMLAQLLRSGRRPDPAARQPWHDGGCLTATGPARAWLHDAHLFAVALHGAALLFNLLVAERYERAGLSRIEPPVQRYRVALQAWADEVSAIAPQLAGWDRGAFWSRVQAANPRVSIETRAFVETWVEAIGQGRDPADPRLRSLVTRREHRVKQAQSRLSNDRLLRTWSGASGAAMLSFRWATVGPMVRDITDALA